MSAQERRSAAPPSPHRRAPYGLNGGARGQGAGRSVRRATWPPTYAGPVAAPIAAVPYEPANRHMRGRDVARPRPPPQRRARPARLSRARMAWRSSPGRSSSRRSARASCSAWCGSPSGCRPTRRSATTGCARCSACADVPPLGAPLRRLIEWTADYYLAPPAAVLRMALASTSRAGGRAHRHRISRDRHVARPADAAARAGAGADRRPTGTDPRTRDDRRRLRRGDPRAGARPARSRRSRSISTALPRARSRSRRRPTCRPTSAPPPTR